MPTGPQYPHGSPHVIPGEIPLNHRSFRAASAPRPRAQVSPEKVPGRSAFITTCNQSLQPLSKKFPAPTAPRAFIPCKPDNLPNPINLSLFATQEYGCDDLGDQEDKKEGTETQGANERIKEKSKREKAD